jgi:magnesium transporter
VGVSAGDQLATIKLCIAADGGICTTKTASIDDAFGNDSQLVWLDLDRGDRDGIHQLAKRFHFHELAVEDALKGGQRPKLDLYEDQIFIVFYGISISEGSVSTSELSCFIGPNFLVTIHDGEFPALETVATRWNSVASTKREQPKGLLLYAILDGIVDGYFPVVDELGERMEQLETLIFEISEAETRQQVFQLRRELLGLRRIVSAERDVVNQLLRHDLPMFSHEVSLYLTDVYDHLLRSYDWLDSYRDQLATLLDLQNAAAAIRLNQIMKTLTASSIILMSATLVAGIYGMNFEHMPELDWLLGYPFALALMLILCLALYVQFRKRDWF